jgi:hypothetical protein
MTRTSPLDLALRVLSGLDLATKKKKEASLDLALKPSLPNLF